MNKPPPACSNVHEIADQVKHSFATATQLLAETQYRLGELTGLHVLDAAESMTLQHNLIAVWEHLYFGFIQASRHKNTNSPRGGIAYADAPRDFINTEDRSKKLREDPYKNFRDRLSGRVTDDCNIRRSECL